MAFVKNFENMTISQDGLKTIVGRVRELRDRGHKIYVESKFDHTVEFYSSMDSCEPIAGPFRSTYEAMDFLAAYDIGYIEGQDEGYKVAIDELKQRQSITVVVAGSKYAGYATVGGTMSIEPEVSGRLEEAVCKSLHRFTAEEIESGILLRVEYRDLAAIAASRS